MLITPMDLQDKPHIVEKKEKVKSNDFQYPLKFKSAVTASILFIILSQNVSYKVFDILFKTLPINISLIDENENNTFVGTLVMAFVIGIIIFLT